MKIIKRSYKGVGFGPKGAGRITIKKYDKPLPEAPLITWIKKLFGKKK